jgi:multiple sugar transport system substrate-binding protein
MERFPFVSRLMLPALFCAFLWTGCGTKRPAVILAVGGAPAELDFWNSVAARFEAQSGIPVELLRQPTDTDQRRQNLVTALRSSQATPDCFLMDVAWIAQFAASAWLEPLAPLLEQSDLAAGNFFAPVVEKASTYNGTLYALPVYVDGGLLYYRTDLLEKYNYAAPPETWEELLVMARDITDKERREGAALDGFVWQGAQYEGLVCTFLEFAASNGGGITLAGNMPIVATQQNREALDFMRRLILVDKISPPNTATDMKEEEVRRAFESGTALFQRNWPYAWMLHQAENSPVRGKVGITVLPRFATGRPAATLGGWHIGISRFSRRKEEAFSLVSYLLSFETQREMALHLGWNPGRTDVYNDAEVLHRLPHLATLREAFSHVVARPAVPWYSSLSAVLQRNLNAALAGTVTADAAMDNSEQELRVLVEQYRDER